MTVKELREALTRFPDDATVYTVEEFYGNPVNEIDTVEYKTASKWNFQRMQYVETEPRVTIR